MLVLPLTLTLSLAILVLVVSKVQGRQLSDTSGIAKILGTIDPRAILERYRPYTVSGPYTAPLAKIYSLGPPKTRFSRFSTPICRSIDRTDLPKMNR